MPDNPEFRRLLWFLLGGTRGGENRARIIDQLRNRPSNLHQLSKQLGLDYKAIQHHMEVLRRNSLVVTSGEGYGKTYFLAPLLEDHLDIFDEVCKKLGFHSNAASGQASYPK